MTDEVEVTAAQTIRWLHDDGLRRLAAFAERSNGACVAYTVACADGAIVGYPAVGSSVVETSADELPELQDSPGRLVVVGVLIGEMVLVVDFSALVGIGIVADNAPSVVRSWAAQLLLNPDIMLATNDRADMGITPRYRYTFIPGGGATRVTVDDGNPPVTTITLNPETMVQDRLEVAARGGTMCIGARTWRLRHVMAIDEAAWASLAASVAGSA